MYICIFWLLASLKMSLFDAWAEHDILCLGTVLWPFQQLLSYLSGVTKEPSARVNFVSFCTLTWNFIIFLLYVVLWNLKIICLFRCLFRVWRASPMSKLKICFQLRICSSCFSSLCSSLGMLLGLGPSWFSLLFFILSSCFCCILNVRLPSPHQNPTLGAQCNGSVA